MNPESELLGDRPVRLPRDHEARATARARRPAAAVRWTALVVAVLLLGITAVVVDGRDRARESSAVAACAARLRLATGYAERRLGLVTNYVEPTLAADGRVQVLHLADLMSARAGRVLPRVQRADRFCRNVTVRPWHFSLVTRQSTSTAYAAALVTLVETVAAQGHVPFRADPTLQSLRDQLGVDGG